MCYYWYRARSSHSRGTQQYFGREGVLLARSPSHTVAERAVLLGKAGLFSSLHDAELEVVGAASEVVEVAAGQVIFEPDSIGRSLFVIESGEIVIRSDLEAGSGRDLARFISGECFGELDLLLGTPRTAWAVADTNARLVRFPARNREFRDVLQEHPVISARILAKLLAGIAGRIRSTNKLVSDNTPWVRELRRQVFVDKLTGLYNSAYLKDQLSTLSRNPQQPFTLLMMKPDNFKEVNDTYGHEAGDTTLKRLANLFSRAMSGDRTAIRYRGNEMAAILPREDAEEAQALAVTLGEQVRSMDISDCTGGVPVTVTVSFGIGCFPGDRADTEALVTDTHALLFVARAAGGDRILRVEASP